MNNLAINTPVQRLAATTDYTNGRTGHVVEIDETNNRYRVLWLKEANGRDIRDGKGLRTWVRREFLKEI